jgi:hypothetical protein
VLGRSARDFGVNCEGREIGRDSGRGDVRPEDKDPCYGGVVSTMNRRFSEAFTRPHGLARSK